MAHRNGHLMLNLSVESPVILCITFDHSYFPHLNDILITFNHLIRLTLTHKCDFFRQKKLHMGWFSIQGIRCTRRN